MTVLFEMPIQLGGDPGEFSEFSALRAELGKMNHPACPDVDWAQVEVLCLALFRVNGAELQTAVCYALACGQRTGLPGLVRGLALVESLVREWSQMWPPQPAARLALLDWLFDHLPPLLRRMDIGTVDGQALVELHAGLDHLNRLLLSQADTAPLALDALCRQVAQMLARVEPERVLITRPVLLADRQPTIRRLPELIPVVPVLPAVARKRRLPGWVVSAMALVLVSMGLLTWHWFAESRSEAVPPAPVQLSSLSLFDAGSAQLRADSTRMLIDALVDIKARSGWLIVISGHADGTGDTTRNLQLSFDRASAVKTWIQSMGDFPDSCFAVQGLGAGQPVASDLNEAGRTANRRVDIRLVPQDGSCTDEA
ncbi:OmpA family protein [Pseudomonas sp. NPDC090202]|uniref:OmpA family protein n=1 Tax=unclassified Pseudomonas TaxID=196821 RepID=UPI0037F829EB